MMTVFLALAHGTRRNQAGAKDHCPLLAGFDGLLVLKA